jgi:hypothetical protein
VIRWILECLRSGRELEQSTLDELVLVGQGWVLAFGEGKTAVEKSFEGLEKKLLALREEISTKRSAQDWLAAVVLKYLQEVEDMINRRKHMTETIAEKAQDVREKKFRGSKGEMFQMLHQLGAMYKEKLLIGRPEFFQSVLALLENRLHRDSDLETVSLEEVQVDSLWTDKRPELVVVKDIWKPETKEVFLSYDPKMVDCAVETEILPGKVEASSGLDEWEKLKRIVHMADIKNRKTVSTQTIKSSFRESKSAQIYDIKESHTNTVAEKGVNPVRTRRYLAGLRGEDDQQHFIDVQWKIA